MPTNKLWFNDEIATVCLADRKATYHGKKQAIMNARDASERSGDTIVAYECICGCFHMGHAHDNTMFTIAQKLVSEKVRRRMRFPIEFDEDEEETLIRVSPGERMKRF